MSPEEREKEEEAHLGKMFDENLVAVDSLSALLKVWLVRFLVPFFASDSVTHYFLNLAIPTPRTIRTREDAAHRHYTCAPTLPPTHTHTHTNTVADQVKPRK